jgi:hypothetical protein
MNPDRKTTLMGWIGLIVIIIVEVMLKNFNLL